MAIATRMCRYSLRRGLPVLCTWRHFKVSATFVYRSTLFRRLLFTSVYIVFLQGKYSLYILAHLETVQCRRMDKHVHTGHVGLGTKTVFPYIGLRWHLL